MYSLQLNPAGPPASGYFPLGFVHGDPEQRVQLGTNEEQDSQSNPAFAMGASAVVPYGKTNPYGLRFFSLAWAQNSLAVAMRQHASGTVGETKYGSMSFQLDDKGKATNKPSVFDPKVRQFLLAYATAHVQSRLASPIAKSVIEWGLDNEWEGSVDYGSGARAAFEIWLRNAYQEKIGGLNEAWGADLKDFHDAANGPLPTDQQYRESPGKFLDWWNFQSDAYVQVLAQMAGAMHDADPLKRGVMYKSTQQTIEMPSVNRLRTFSHERFADLMRPISGGRYGADAYGSGDRETYEVNFLYNAIRPEDKAPGYGVFLAEVNNHDGPGHQFASTMWRLLPNGLKGADLFTMGWAGAKQDWDKFGFINASTGAPKDKLFYAARWIHAIQRAEGFWEEAIPAANAPRVALLMPRRDVLLSDQQTGGSKWSYPENNRWMVFRRLREQGYWVDVIPSTKLSSNYLNGYQALFLVGADHLTVNEAKSITDFVSSGKVLVADTQAGYFDEHHRVRRQLEPVLGLQVIGLDPEAAIDLGQIGLNAHVLAAVKAEEAEKVGTWNGVSAYKHRYGKGEALYVPFALGSMAAKGQTGAHMGFTPVGPTAESEEHLAAGDEFGVGVWLGKILAAAGLTPAYRQTSARPSWMGVLRVEQPMMDSHGNVAIVISNRAQTLGAKNEQVQEIVPPVEIEVPIPGGPWSEVFWAAAEGDSFTPITLHPGKNQTYSLDLPKITTAGVLYLLRDSPPLLGLTATGDKFSVDGFGVKVKPGVSFKVTTRIVNGASHRLASGTVRLQGLAGWKLEPSVQNVPEMKSGSSIDLTFTVTPPAGDLALKSDWLYPLVAHWSDGVRDRAVSTMSVEAEVPPSTGRLLLTDNKGFPDDYPYRARTGATYSYSAPASAKIADPLRNGVVERETTLLQGRAFNGFQETRIAQFQDDNTDIIFDLKDQHELAAVSLTRDGQILPTSVQFFVSDDGRKYVPITTLNFTNTDLPPLKIETPPLHVRGRYVRVKVQWPRPGGRLAEAEVWGR